MQAQQVQDFKNTFPELLANSQPAQTQSVDTLKNLKKKYQNSIYILFWCLSFFLFKAKLCK